jgi:uncharacterized membrane protein
LRVETIPLILGILVALVGIGLLADAWLPEEVTFRRERRRSVREERHRGGEAAIGIGVLCMAAALIGRDTWPYGNVAMILGAIVIIIGGVLNKRYFRDRIANRGALRRGKGLGAKTPEKNDRIR